MKFVDVERAPPLAATFAHMMKFPEDDSARLAAGRAKNASKTAAMRLERATISVSTLILAKFLLLVNQ
jgi:hypothetical protein